MRKLALLLLFAALMLSLGASAASAQTTIAANSSNGMAIGFSAGSTSLGTMPGSLPTESLDRAAETSEDPSRPGATAYSGDGSGVLLVGTAHMTRGNHKVCHGEDHGDDHDDDDDCKPTPEPQSILLLGSGLAAVTILLRRRQLV
jgi:hypothetical protein